MRANGLDPDSDDDGVPNWIDPENERSFSNASRASSFRPACQSTSTQPARAKDPPTPGRIAPTAISTFPETRDGAPPRRQYRHADPIRFPVAV